MCIKFEQQVDTESNTIKQEVWQGEKLRKFSESSMIYQAKTVQISICN